MDNINNLIKSCIISSKGGISLRDLDDEYYGLIGSRIPYKTNGYNSIADYLGSIPGIFMKTDVWGDVIVYARSYKSAHITSMISKQKNSNQLTKTSLKDANNNGYKICNPISSDKNCTILRSDRDKQNNFKRHNNKENMRSIRVQNWFHKQINKKINKPSLKLGSPHIFNYQLIGDDFLLSMSFKNLEYLINRDAYPYRSGTCVSGLTLQNAINYLRNIDLPNQVFLMLGSVDILLGRSIKQMKNDMKNLLLYLEMRGVDVVVSTLPPLANIFHRSVLVQTLIQFNNWLLAYVIEDYMSCGIVDLWKLFVDKSYHIIFDYYEQDAIYGTSNNQPLVLWNCKGRVLVEQVLRSQLCSPFLCENRNLCRNRNSEISR